jgi:hypothetical protein
VAALNWNVPGASLSAIVRVVVSGRPTTPLLGLRNWMMTVSSGS